MTNLSPPVCLVLGYKFTEVLVYQLILRRRFQQKQTPTRSFYRALGDLHVLVLSVLYRAVGAPQLPSLDKVASPCPEIEGEREGRESRR